MLNTICKVNPKVISKLLFCNTDQLIPDENGNETIFARIANAFAKKRDLSPQPGYLMVCHQHQD